MKASKIASIIEKQAPLNLAESWDNPGFQIGKKSKDITKVLTALDITPEILEEALDNGVEMIIAHHPFFFRGIKNIDLSTTKGKMIEDIIKNDLVIYTAHTNLDKSEFGINYYVGKLLGLKDLKPLVPDNKNFGYYKLVVYAPDEYEESIRSVFKKLDLGFVGDKYRDSTFRSAGLSTFRPLENANPFLGETNILEEVEETKIETIVPKNKISEALKEIKKEHPYEEMAYDLFPIELREQATKEGLGVIGSYKESLETQDFINKVKEVFKEDHIREAGPRPKKVKKVAICTGAGAEYIRLARNKKADVYITGDLKHHDGQTAYEEKVWVLDVGHYGTEKFTIQLLKELLADEVEDVEIIEAKNSQAYLKELS